MQNCSIGISRMLLWNYAFVIQQPDFCIHSTYLQKLKCVSKWTSQVDLICKPIHTGCLIMKWSKVNGSGGRRIDSFVDLWYLVCSRGLLIWVSSTGFKKVKLADLNSLRQKEYQISVKNEILDDLFHKKGPVLVIYFRSLLYETPCTVIH